jgi:hypothetical protein
LCGEDSEVSRQPLGHDGNCSQDVNQFLVRVGRLSLIVHSGFLQSGDLSFSLSSLPTGKKEAHRTKKQKNNFAIRQISLTEGKTV